jgi:hypothetical protein
MHATNTFPVDRHPQYRHYPTRIRSIASGIIIEVRKKHIRSSMESFTFGPTPKIDFTADQITHWQKLES